MYIPIMSLVTYIFLSTLIAGLRGQFQPELFGYTASTALLSVGLEIGLLKLGCYLLSISNESQLLDLIAYSGYKFVGIITTICVAEIANAGKGTGGWIGWTVFIYTFLANSLFLVGETGNVSHRAAANKQPTDAIAEVCLATRSHRECRRGHADGDSDEEKPEDTVLVLLLLRCPAGLYVVSKSAMRLVSCHPTEIDGTSGSACDMG